MSYSDLEDELVRSAPWLIANKADAQKFIEKAIANGELVDSEWRGELADQATREKLFEEFARKRF